MKLSVTQENLARALGVVGRVASNRAGLPILNNILFHTEGNRLLLAATNLEIAATYYIGAKVETPGVITLPAKLVSEFVANLPKTFRSCRRLMKSNRCAIALPRPILSRRQPRPW